MYTVFVSEIQYGFAEFETEGEAIAFLDGSARDYDQVEWFDGETIDMEIEYPSQFSN